MQSSATNAVLHRKKSLKYLGVLVDESLNWTSHVKYLNLSYCLLQVWYIKFETMLQLML